MQSKPLTIRRTLFAVALLAPAVVLAQREAPVLAPAPEQRVQQVQRQQEIARERAEERRVSSELRREEVEHAREEMQQAREALREAERELERVAQRAGILAQKAASAEIARAMSAPSFGRPMIGIVMSPDDEGVRLAAVTPRSPAAKAGLRTGDHLTSIDGTPLGNGDPPAQLERARTLIGDLEEDEEVRVGYSRAGTEHVVVLRAEVLPGLGWLRDSDALAPLAQMRDIDLDLERMLISPFAGCAGGDCDFHWVSHALRWRGLRLAEVDPQLGRYFGVDRGVLVLKADGEGLEALQPGDVILAIDGDAVETPSEAMERLGDAEGGNDVALRIQRDRRATTTTMTVPKFARWQLMVPPAPPAPPPPPAPPRPHAAPEPRTPAAPPAPPPPPEPRGVLDRVLR